MLKSGQVSAIGDGYITVKIPIITPTCSGCHGLCNPFALFNKTVNKPAAHTTITIPTSKHTQGLRIGDKVQYQTQHTHIVRSILVAYFLPTLMALIGLWLGAYLSPSLASQLAGLAIGLSSAALVMRAYNRKEYKRVHQFIRFH